jgi:hypothetical protein
LFSFVLCIFIIPQILYLSSVFFKNCVSFYRHTIPGKFLTSAKTSSSPATMHSMA